MIQEAEKEVEIRVKGRPAMTFGGRIEKIFPAGQDTLPSEALGYRVGGSMPTQSGPQQGTKAAERFFEVRIRPDAAATLLTGQRITARVSLPAQPLLVQWYGSARRLFQRRFHI